MSIRRGRNALSLRVVLPLLLIWISASVWLWSWWLRADINNNVLYSLTTFALAFEYLLMPGFFLFALLNSKSKKQRTFKSARKTAIISPCVPSQESLKVIERQLKAMTAVEYPHDSWILDDEGDPKVKALAKKYKVKYFTRKNIKKYNQDDYPFKSKTKAGNINAWLDMAKKYKYDYFVQMDIDHNPSADYLHKTLGHFNDKKVAWVQAPSVYRNLDNWIARASAEQETGFHGPIQMALCTVADAPIIVGSHTTFRMKAVNEMGGFQQTRAEDHLNTLVLMKNGWNGVFIPEVIAEGDGPEAFDAYFSQQSAWAFSMTQIVRNYSFRLLPKLSFKRALLFGLIESWYPLWALTYFIFYLVPIVSVATNTKVIMGQETDFMLRVLPAVTASFIVLAASKKLAQPVTAQPTWRGLILHVVRWPVIFSAVIGGFMNRARPYQITPKGRFTKSVPTVKLYLPFLILGVISALSIFIGYFMHGVSQTGLEIFAYTNMSMLISVCVLDLVLKMQSQNISFKQLTPTWLKPVTAVCMVALISYGSLIPMTASTSAIQVEISSSVVENQDEYRNTAPSLLTHEQRLYEINRLKDTQEYHGTTNRGMHSPGDYPEGLEPYIEHHFIDWREYYNLSILLLETKRRGNDAFITIEPRGIADGTVLLQEIAQGKHDDKLIQLLETVKNSGGTNYLRFAHEMDLANLYAWGNKNPTLYKKAYKRFVDISRTMNVQNIKWIWGPAGVVGAGAYYPGDDYADIVGTTVLQDSYWTGSTKFTFYEYTVERFWIFGLNKPVWITEFGAGSSDREYQQTLLREASSEFENYGFDALVYVNIKDSNIKGPNYVYENSDMLARDLGIIDQKYNPISDVIDFPQKKPIDILNNK